MTVSACTDDQSDGSGDASPSPQPSPGGPSPTSAGEPEVTDATEVIATGLEVPWDIDFLPDGSALITERTTGRLLRLGPETDDQGLLRSSEVTTVEDVNPAGEGGLLGVAVSPDFDTDGAIFLYYTTATDNRIARLHLDSPDDTPEQPPEPILTGIPAAGNHNGGRIAFGPDGYLYASTGDAGQRQRSQDRDSLAGKILRMTPDGAPAPDNPFGNHMWAYGLRNVQGLAWDAGDRMWVTEFGENEWDEINLIDPGENYGWPEVEGTGGGDQYVDPIVTWRPAEAACSGAAVTGDTLVAACLRGQRLWLMDLTESGTVMGAPRPLLEEEYGRLRAVVVAPDGSLWVTTSNRDGRLPEGPGPDDDRIVRVGVSTDSDDGGGQS